MANQNQTKKKGFNTKMRLELQITRLRLLDLKGASLGSYSYRHCLWFYLSLFSVHSYRLLFLQIRIQVSRPYLYSPQAKYDFDAPAFNAYFRGELTRFETYTYDSESALPDFLSWAIENRAVPLCFDSIYFPLPDLWGWLVYSEIPDSISWY